jgi:small subunit ribosomal protein S13
MARITGVELQDNWRVIYALTKIRGVGWSLSKDVLDAVGVGFEKRVSELTPKEIAQIASKLEDYSTEGEVIRQVKRNISRLQAIGSFRGTRHAKSLPARGQRTRRNARQKRGKRKTVGAYRKEALAKMQQQKTKKESKN